ncbi:MAG: nucleotidyltransferase family protein [Planctomycetes bacterium]|nr:nucleotidyltransferase family protein [Planctomycetota bacterium]
MNPNGLDISQSKVAEFCSRWRITELALFGSVLRPDFRADSDVDVLVTFAADATWSLFDLVEMRDELRELFGRNVDLVEGAALRNPYRRRAILREKEVIFAA